MISKIFFSVAAVMVMTSAVALASIEIHAGLILRQTVLL